MRRALLVILLFVLGGVSLAQTAEPAKKKYILLGSTLEDVIAAFGQPTSVNVLDEAAGRATLRYEQYSGSVTLKAKLVTGWTFSQKSYPVLPVQANAQPCAPGASREDVLKVIGFPSSASLKTKPLKGGGILKEELWVFKKSTLTFYNEHLVGWHNVDGLKLSLGNKTPGAPLITLGSTTQEVVNALGTPTHLEPVGEGQDGEWGYGSASVHFNAGHVAGWIDYARVLPLDKGGVKAGAILPKLDSSQKDVIGALGIPLAIIPTADGGTLWFYERNMLKLGATNMVVELATPRLIARLTSRQLKLDEWPGITKWALAQLHLDYHEGLMTDKQIYDDFVKRVTDELLYAQFRRDRTNELIDRAYNTGGQQVNTSYVDGVKYALSVENPEQIKILVQRERNKDYAAGARTVYDLYMQTRDNYKNSAYNTYIQQNFFLMPEVKNKRLVEVKSMFEKAGCAVDVVLFRSTTVASGFVADAYPYAGFHALLKTPVTLYVAQ
ncbi:MAG: PASTA domain-containing protein [Armatimonadota bacterium]